MHLDRLAAGVAVAVMLAACSQDKPGNDAPAAKPQVATAAPATRPDPRNATYQIEGSTIAMKNGVAEGEPVAPGSAMRERTTLFGEPVFGDLDGDGDEDAAVVLANDPGGSGTFIYLAAVVQDGKEQRATNAVLLGDRIGEPALTIDKGVIHARFLDRPETATFADPPSVPRVVDATLQSGQLVASGDDKRDGDE